MTRRISILLAPFLGALVFMATTNPYELPLQFMAVPIVLLSLGVYSILLHTLRHVAMSASKARFISISLTLALLLLLMLQSVRQLSLRDFLIISFLLIGLAFYIKRFNK